MPDRDRNNLSAFCRLCLLQGRRRARRQRSTSATSAGVGAPLQLIPTAVNRKGRVVDLIAVGELLLAVFLAVMDGVFVAAESASVKSDRPRERDPRPREALGAALGDGRPDFARPEVLDAHGCRLCNSSLFDPLGQEVYLPLGAGRTSRWLPAVRQVGFNRYFQSGAQ